MGWTSLPSYHGRTKRQRHNDTQRQRNLKIEYRPLVEILSLFLWGVLKPLPFLRAGQNVGRCETRRRITKQYESISVNRNSIVAHLPPIVNEHDDEHEHNDNEHDDNEHDTQRQLE